MEKRMRHNSSNDTGQAKAIARKRYAERQIAKWVKWSFETKGIIRYKDLLETIETFSKNN
jgi:hypothetical protein